MSVSTGHEGHVPCEQTAQLRGVRLPQLYRLRSLYRIASTIAQFFAVGKGKIAIPGQDLRAAAFPRRKISLYKRKET